MSKLLDALKIFRPINILILLATQVLVYLYLSSTRLWWDLSNPVFLKVILITALVAMAGNLQNDWFDKKADEINKPGKNYAQCWPGSWSLGVAYVLLNVYALTLSWLLAQTIFYLVLIIIALLFLYNRWLKRIAVIGNLVISFLAASALVLVGLVSEEVDTVLLGFYVGFAFLTTMIRELIKDAEDVDGDRHAGYKTLPVLIGNRRTNRVIGNLTVFAIVLLFTFAYQSLSMYFQSTYAIIVIAYGLVCVAFPMVYVLWKTYTQSMVDYSQLSNLMKYVMVTGMASMLFF